MTPLDRITPSLRSAWLPLALLLTALSTVFVFSGDRGYFYRPVGYHNWMSSHHLSIAVNLSPERGFQRFMRRLIDDDGVTRYGQPYNRFPIGGYAAMKVATLPFGWGPAAPLHAARILMLVFFTAVAVLAYLSLCRLVSNRWIALTAVLLAFSSYYLLYYNDMTANEGMLDLFGVMLTFHGMIIFVQEGRFRQLIVKACIALLLGWHVLALLLPFVIFGLGRDLLRARSAAADSTASDAASSRHLAYTLLRSRFLLLGVATLTFGLSLLAFNFTMEYAALNGERPLTDLPSFRSMVIRTGVDPSSLANLAADLAWPTFLEEQFRSILRMFVPYALLGGGDADESPMWLSKGWGVFLGVVLSAASLIGSMLVRPRIPFATLASLGFFWALPMRHTTATHDFERIYYIGLPLVFFTVALLLARRLTNRDGVIAAASVMALLLFTASSFQMSRADRSAETAQLARDAEQDMLAIRELTTGDLVTILYIGGTHENFSAWAGAVHAVDYYLSARLIRYAYLPAVEGGAVVMRERIDTDALLTPQNRQFFLYDRDGLEAWYATKYRSVASGEPVARKVFDVYLIDGKVYYLKEPCERADAAGRLFLHIYPFDEDNLPAHRRQHEFDNLDFAFIERGLLFDGKCLAIVDLPQYDVVKIDTGRVDGDAWRATHVVVSPNLTLRYRTIVSREPAGRSEFDVYIDGGKLHYVKEPCVYADTAARFFLHITPEDENDLPSHRREHGFDNLDFDFAGRGVLFGGKCMVSVDLPQYGIAQIVTGQFDGDGRVWGVEFAPEAGR